MTVVLLLPLLVIAAVAWVVLERRHGRVEAWRFLRTIAMSLAVLFAVFAGLFIAGETFEDPGGAVAVALVASWLVPMAGLAALAWWAPRVATVVLAVAVLAVVVVGLWYALATDAWRSFEDDTGPVRAIAVFALCLPLALLAWRRPLLGGVLLVGLAVVPGVLALASAGGGGAGGATVAATSPASVIGLLFVASSWPGRPSGPRDPAPASPSAEADPRP